MTTDRTPWWVWLFSALELIVILFGSYGFWSSYGPLIGIASGTLFYLWVGFLLWGPVLRGEVSKWVIPFWLPALFSEKLRDELT